MSAGPHMPLDTSFVTIRLSETQAARIRDGIRAGNTEFSVWGPRPTLKVLHRHGLVTTADAGAKLTDEGKEVARQLKMHPRRRTFTVQKPDERQDAP